MNFLNRLILSTVLITLCIGSVLADEDPKIPFSVQNTKFVKNILDSGDQKNIATLETFFAELKKLTGSKYSRLVSSARFTAMLADLEHARDLSLYDKKVAYLIHAQRKLKSDLVDHIEKNYELVLVFLSNMEREATSLIDILSYNGVTGGGELDFRSAYYYKEVVLTPGTPISEDRASNIFRDTYLLDKISKKRVTVDALLYAHNAIKEREVVFASVAAILDYSGQTPEQLFMEDNKTFNTRVAVTVFFSEQLSDASFVEMLDLYATRHLADEGTLTSVQTICRIADKYAETTLSVNRVLSEIKRTVYGYKGDGSVIGRDLLGSEVVTLSPELNEKMSNYILSTEADFGTYYGLRDLFSQIAFANNYSFLELLLERVSDARNHITMADRWNVSVEADLVRAEQLILLKMQGLKEKDYISKLVDYISDVSTEDLYLPVKDPKDMNVAELMNALIDKLAYEIAYYGNVDRAKEVLTDTVVISTAISFLKGSDSSIILDEVKELLKDAVAKEPGTAVYIEQGLAALESVLPKVTRTTAVENKTTPTTENKPHVVKEPASIAEALILSSDIYLLVSEFPEVFSFEHIIDFIGTAKALPKAKALNVLSQASLMLNLLVFTDEEVKQLQNKITDMEQKILQQDKELLVKRILNFYEQNSLLSYTKQVPIDNDAVIQDFKNYLLMKNVLVEGNSQLCEIVFGTMEREQEDSLLAFKSSESNDGLLYLLLLSNNSTVIFDGSQVDLVDFLSNSVSKKVSFIPYFVEQTNATLKIPGKFYVTRDGVTSLIELPEAIKEKTSQLLQKIEFKSSLKLVK